MSDLKSLEKLKDEFEKFPSVGTKSAERIAYNFLTMSDEDVKKILDSINDVRTKIHKCPICGLLTEQDSCVICSDPNRNHDICIVMLDSKDVGVFDKVDNFNGVYHVLNSVANPSKMNINDNSGINDFVKRVEKEKIKEVILTFGTSIEEQVTTIILSNLLTPLGVKISKIAHGVQHGQSLEYVDTLSLKDALEGRVELK